MDTANHESPTTALRAAIKAIGSQSATGRLLGVSQAAVWRWLDKELPLPAEHVLAVEAATGISRHALRPDIYGPAPAAAIAAASTPIARASVPVFLSTPGREPPRGGWSDVQLGERVR